MKRRRQETLWIHQWSRPLIGAIAAVGAAGTGYLTVTKLMQGTAACAAGCDKVLNSEWAEIVGQPLTLFGCLAYLSMLVLAIAPLLVNAEHNKDQRTKLEGITWPLLFVGATGMMVFSGFLMFVLATSIKAVCPYCIASALMSTTMFILTVLGRRWDDRGQLLFSGAIVAMVALVGTFGIYAVPGGPLSTGTQAAEVEGAGPAITTTSGEAEIALANHLTEVGAKMYSAYWCPHCHDQKQLFGKQAVAKMPYVECDPNGQNSQTALCQSIPEIKGFPTWEVKGEFLSGTQSLATLALASGYEGSMNFVNENSEETSGGQSSTP
ncbi:MAG: vitamin K epoxide reductase family protein [Phormidesmis sp.]